jgi:hypothetical protein
LFNLANDLEFLADGARYVSDWAPPSCFPHVFLEQAVFEQDIAQHFFEPPPSVLNS